MKSGVPAAGRATTNVSSAYRVELFKEKARQTTLLGFVIVPDLMTTGVSVTVVEVNILVTSAMSNPSKYFV